MQTLKTCIDLLADELICQGATLVTAESCTGGEIAARLTDKAGSSAWFQGGVISYSNQLKEQLLGVSPWTLRSHGAVSQPTAEQMALGARQRLQADYAIATTGIAGPGGGTADKPVGMVWFALAGEKGIYSDIQYFRGNRGAVREQATLYAIKLALKYLKSKG